MTSLSEHDQELLRQWCDNSDDHPPGLEAWALIRRLADYIAALETDIAEMRDACIDLDNTLNRIVGDFT